MCKISTAKLQIFESEIAVAKADSGAAQATAVRQSASGEEGSFFSRERAAFLPVLISCFAFRSNAAGFLPEVAARSRYCLPGCGLRETYFPSR